MNYVKLGVVLHYSVLLYSSRLDMMICGTRWWYQLIMNLVKIAVRDLLDNYDKFKKLRKIDSSEISSTHDRRRYTHYTIYPLYYYTPFTVFEALRLIESCSVGMF